MQILRSALLLLTLVLLVFGQGSYIASASAADQTALPPTEVTVRIYQAPQTTALDLMVVAATVTSEGAPVAGANVSFADSFQSAFIPATVPTNSTGVALTQAVFINPNAHNDTISASASAQGYQPSKGKLVVWSFPISIQQLTVTAAVTNSGAAGGSMEVIQGYVGSVWSSSTTWNGKITGVGDAVITLSDIAGSVFPQKVTTDDLGFYSANFTLGKPASPVADVISVSAAAPLFNGSTSTVLTQVSGYGQQALTVTLSPVLPTPYSTVLSFATLQAKVTAGGTPVAGVPVSFSDSLGALFFGKVEKTDSSGIATSTAYFVYNDSGLDVFSAKASEQGMGQGAGSNALPVRDLGKTQLSVSEILASSDPVAGATDKVTGEVGWVSGSVSYTWSPMQNAVANATVVISDSLGAFAPFNVTTNAKGIYSAAFTAPPTGETDVIQASATAQGYKSEGSSVFLVSVPPEPANATAKVASSATSAVSSASSTTAQSSSSLSVSNISPPRSGASAPAPLTLALALVALAAGSLVVLGVARRSRSRAPHVQ